MKKMLLSIMTLVILLSCSTKAVSQPLDNKKEVDSVRDYSQTLGTTITFEP